MIPRKAAKADLFLFQQIIPRQKVRHRHTEGLPAGFLPQLFVLCAGVGVCHGLPGVVDRPGETLAVCLLRLAPLDPGHIGGLHDGLLAVHPAVGQFSDLSFDPSKGCVEHYFGHCILAFALWCGFVSHQSYINPALILH